MTRQIPRLPFASRALSLVILMLVTSHGWAHGARCKRIDNAMGIQAVYDNGNPIAEAKVSVYRPGNDETPWRTGSTDETGCFFFAPDADGDWTVQVEDAQGHLASFSFQVEAGATAKEPPQSAEKPSALHFIVALAVIFGVFGAFSLLRRR
jgi:nickel transport protein